MRRDAPQVAAPLRAQARLECADADMDSTRGRERICVPLSPSAHPKKLETSTFHPGLPFPPTHAHTEWQRRESEHPPGGAAACPEPAEKAGAARSSPCAWCGESTGDGRMSMGGSRAVAEGAGRVIGRRVLSMPPVRPGHGVLRPWGSRTDGLSFAAMHMARPAAPCLPMKR
ncbi:hypothetical protein GY45DRAFT_1044125 [Cubamyces sp. BRFM 1775]|nr:hypothetical protein GY45DRAFT_1044125 [Cubamyces sp. BRFM 1775]